MDREPNTDLEGRPFSHEVIEAVWHKARTMGIYETLRVDAWGWTIVRQDYGNTQQDPTKYNFNPNFSADNNSKTFQVAPQDSGCDWRITQTAHTGGMQACLGDGSVRTISSAISAVTWIRACDPRDGGVLGSDW